MKKTLLFLFLLCGFNVFAQVEISGDTMLCPNTNGTATITSGAIYDSYSWYYKYWFTSDDFQAIPGADGPSFTYDWYTYDQALIKVVVTLGDIVMESNAIQIDSYAWLPISTGFEMTDNVSIDSENGNVLLCAGTSFTVEVFNPFNTNIRWFRDGIGIPDADTMSLVISEPGVYHVEASPGICPDNMSSTAGTPIVVVINNDCELGLPQQGIASLRAYPNPVRNQFSLTASEIIRQVKIYNLQGQQVLSAAPQSDKATIDLQSLASGVYILEAAGAHATQKIKIVKE